MRCSRDMTNGWLPLSLTRLDGQLKEKYWGHKPLSVEIPLLSWTLTLRGTKLQSYFCFFCHHNLTFGQQFLLCGPPGFLKNQFDVSQTPINVSKPLCMKTLWELCGHQRCEREGGKNIFLKRCSAELRYPAEKMVSIFEVTELQRHFRPMFHFTLQLPHSILIEGSPSTIMQRRRVRAGRKAT